MEEPPGAGALRQVVLKAKANTRSPCSVQDSGVGCVLVGGRSGPSPRLGVCGIACLLCNCSSSASGARKGKDDHAAGAGGVHGGHGVGGARRVGVDVPAGRRRDRPRHAGRGDWPLRRGLKNLVPGPPF